MSDKQEKKRLTLLQLIMMVLAFPVMLVREPLVSWYTRTYNREDGADGFRKFFGIISALALGIGRGYSMDALTQPAAWQTYLGPAIGMAALGFYVIFPLFYLKAWKGATELWKLVDTSTYTDEKGKTRREKDTSWLTHLLMFVSHAGALVGSVYAGIFAGNAVHAAMPNIMGGLLGIVVGLISAGFAGVASWAIISWLGLRVLALAFGVYASQAALPTIQGLGLAPDATWAANILTFVASVGYVFPAAHILVSRGLKRIVTEMTKVYNEKDQNYRNVFEHTFNIFESTYLAQAVVGMTGAIAAATQSLIGGVVFLLSYIFVGAMVTSIHKPGQENRGNRDSLRCAGTLVAAHYGWAQGASYLAAGNAFGVGGAIGAGLVHAALCYLLIFPAAYVAIKFFLKPLARPSIGNFLVKMYDEVINIFDKIDEMRKDVYSSKPSSTKTLVQHVVNFGVAIAVGLGVNKLTVENAVAVPQLLSGLAALLSYAVVGRVLTREKIRFFGWNANGMTVLGLLTGISAALMTGVAAVKTTTMAWAVVLGLIVGSVTTAWVFPLAFGILAGLLTAVMPRLTSFLSKTLATVHGFVWGQFKNLVNFFVEGYRMARDFCAYLLKMFKESYQSLKEELDRLFGRKKDSDKKSDEENKDEE